MNPKWPSSHLLAFRRTSCPTVFTELTTTQKRHREQGQTTFAITTKADFAANSSIRTSELRRNSTIHTSELRQNSTIPRRYSSDDGAILVCLNKLQPSQIPHSVDSTLQLHVSKSMTSIYEELFNGRRLEEPILHLEKNAAEIVGDFPVNQRRGSLPAVSSSDRFGSGAVISSAVFITAHGQGQGKRKYHGTLASSVDRELQCLYKNSLEDKRLQQTFSQLDKQSFVDSQGFKQRIHKMFNEYRKLVQVSPTVDEWFATRRSLTQAGRRGRDHSGDGSGRTCSRETNNSRGL